MDKMLQKLCNIDYDNLDASIECFTLVTALLIEKHKQLMKTYIHLKKSYEEKTSDTFLNLKNSEMTKNSTISELKILTENNKECIDLKYRMEYVKIEASSIEKHIENIKNARWDCKNLIDYKKIKQGLI